MILHLLGRRPAIQIVIALWVTFAVLLAINLTLRLTPHEVQFVRQSPATPAPPAAPAVPTPALTTAPVITQQAPIEASPVPQPQRLAGVQTVTGRASTSPASPSPAQQRTKAPATERQKPAPASVKPAPADPCIEACDDPVPAEQPSSGGEDVDPAVTPVPKPEPAPAPSGADPDN